MREVEAALAAEEHGRAASRSSTAGSARAARYRRGTKRRRPHEPPLAASATATLEREALQRGLGSALTSRNVGFRMLARMGFVEGSGLGPPGREGASEPIAISASLASSGGRRGPKRHAGVGRAAEEAVAARAAAAAAAAERARAANASSAQQGDLTPPRLYRAHRPPSPARLRQPAKRTDPDRNRPVHGDHYPVRVRGCAPPPARSVSRRGARSPRATASPPRVPSTLPRALRPHAR